MTHIAIEEDAMPLHCTLGVDAGTSSTGGVVASTDGAVVASVSRTQDVQRPAAGHVEMDGRVWWHGFARSQARRVKEPSA